MCEHRTTSLLILAILCTVISWPSGLAQSSVRADALLLEQQGRTTEAEQAWKSITDADPSNAEAFAHLGLLASRQEHFTDAIDNYNKALALAPAMPGLKMNLGLAFFKSSQFPDAIKVFSALLSLHPDATTANHLTILLGMAHFGMGDYFVAIPYLQRAAERDPQSLALRLTLAHSCLWSKQYDCVLSVYKQILTLDPDSAEADMLAGEALDEKGDTPGAIDQFRAATRVNPKEANAHFGLGYLLWTEQHFAEAAPEFAAELQLNPEHKQALEYLADSLVESNQFKDALPYVDAIASQNGGAEGSAMAHRDRGIVYAELGHPDQAVVELKKAIELDPKYTSAHWRLGKVYQSTGNKEMAKTEFALVSEMKQASSRPLSEAMESASPSHPHP